MGAKLVVVRGPSCGLAVLALFLALAAGCGEPAPEVDAGALDASDMDASGLCADDGDCDDGLFCNGVELCAPGATGADSRGCTAADPATPCAAGQTCEEAGDRCVTECAVATDADGDGSLAIECGGNDCDDSDPLRLPGAVEICDPEDRDEDCDPSTFGFRDADGDLYADASCCNVDDTGARVCGDDCNDARPNVHPALAEACDELDNDCDGTTDEGVTRTFRPDLDHDGYGDATAAPEDLVSGCVPPPDHAESDTDCDDADGAIHPGALEQCDLAALDENCDGTANPDTLCSCSGDVTRGCATLAGVCAAGTERCIAGSWGLCSIAPTPEVCNGVDDDCDGSTDELLSVDCYPDGDNDGYAEAGAIAAPTCPVPGRDAFAGCPPNQTNRPPLGDTGIDCNDANSTISPGAAELCDAAMVDENCDGSANPPLLCSCTDGETRSCSAPGSCGSGNQTCSGGRWSGCTVSPVAESCNSIDDDCDGTVDEELTIGCYVDADNDGHPVGGAMELALCPVMGRAYVGGCPTGFTNLAPAAGATDCNDASAAISPAAIEQCDAAMVDEDCDGTANPAATCACSGSTMRACPQPGVCASGTQTCSGGSWGLCSILPVTESCNGTDDDCDGSSDELLTVSCYADGDNDGYPASGATASSRCPDATRAAVGGCPAGLTNRAPGAGATDCDDVNAGRSPAAAEVCNGSDDDCDGMSDEGATVTCYADGDGDGYPAASATALARCPDPTRPSLGSCPVGTTNRAPAASADCNDASPAISPAAVELCDAAMIDEDCDGAANPGTLCACSGTSTRACPQSGACSAGTQTCSGGSWGACSIGPVTEVCNGVDDDCNGATDEMLLVACYADGDNDGYAASGAASTQRCADASRPQVGGCPTGFTHRAPGAATTDCNDANAAVSPGALEQCNGVDDNCAGGVDEGVRTTFYRDVDGDGFGTASMPVQACSLTTGYSTLGTDCNDGSASVNPAAVERCDTIDNNCDGSTDPGCACTDGATRACTRSGVCASGIETCSAGAWGACSISPMTESCNGLDDDCDGTVDDRDSGGLLTVTCWDDGDDDGYALSGATMRVVCPVSGRSARGGCPYGTTNLAPSGSSSVDCDDASDLRHPGAAEICNGASDDCDALIDEGLTTYARYRDSDGDGREGTTVMACDGAPGTSAVNNDCDETSARRLSIYVGAPELCDRYDDNCDGSGGIGPGQIDPNEDRDDDGYMAVGFSLCTGGTLLPGDCNDDPSAGGASDRPGAPEVCDTRDNDCDGLTDEDPAADASCPSLPGGYAGCSAGSCVLVGCQAGYADCDANGANGCEVDTRATAEHCGGCGLTCGAGAACISGVCDAPIDLDVSRYNTCWLYASGRVGCIGNAVGFGGDSTVPVPVPGVTSAAQLAMYDRHSCVVVSGGAVACWGENTDGAVGNGTPSAWVYSATTVPGLTGVAEVGVGRQFSCARLTTGAVRCWGDNQYGQLGDGTTTDRLAPVTVMLPTGWTATDLEVGGRHACVIAQNGGSQRLYCWGANSDGQMGDGTTGAAQTTPVQAGTVAYSQVAVGDAHTCGITGASLECWGDNASGQTGTGDMPTDHPTPAFLTIAGPAGVVAGGQHACAWQPTGAPRCWGENFNGQLGNGSSLDASAPVGVAGLPGGTNVVRMRASALHTCAQLSDGDWYCWGYNAYGQLGDLTTTEQHTPVRMMGVRSTADVATGFSHSCVRESTGEVRCWGRNSDGQIGSGVLGTEYGTPQPVPGLSGVAEVAGDANTTIVRRFDGTLRAWGDNASGQLGDGTTTDRSAPVSVSGITGAVAIDVGMGHACAVLGSGALSCWGENGSGQLGDGSSTMRTTPVTVALTGVTSVSCGATSTCATTRSGQLYCWGANNAGQLGNGTTTPSLVPLAVPGMIDVVEVTVGAAHACARRADGQVRCWGANGEGQVGDGTRIGRPSPTAVGSLGSLVVIGLEAGYTNTCALVEDGSMRCWGDGVSGQIGDGGFIDRLLPRLVVGGSVYRTFALGSGYHVCASEVAYGVECWGENAGRQIGDGTNTDRTTPTQVQSLP